MLIFRFLLFSLVTSVGVVAVWADAVAPQTGEKPKPAATAEPGITFDWVHVDGPYVAMTFDDGPSAKLTPKLLDLLAAHHIKATFFLIGQNVAQKPDIVAREVREGHEIANHSWSHPNLAKMSDDGVRDSKRKWQSSHFIASTLWFDHSPAKKMDQPGVWLQNCALGRRSIGLEKARTECRLQSHHQNGSRRLDYSGARHSSRHDRGDAVRAEPARGQGLQIRDRF